MFLDSFLNWDSKFFASVGLLIAKAMAPDERIFFRGKTRFATFIRYVFICLPASFFFFAVNYWAKAIHIDPSKLAPKNRTEIEKRILNKKRFGRRKCVAKLEACVAKRLRWQQAAETGAVQRSCNRPQRSGRLFVVFDPSTKASTRFERWLEAHAKEKFGERGTKLQLFLRHALPQPALHDALLHSTVCLCAQDSLSAPSHFLHRSFNLRACIFTASLYVGIMLIVLATIGLNRTAPGPARWLDHCSSLDRVRSANFSFRSAAFYRQSWFVSRI